MPAGQPRRPRSSFPRQGGTRRRTVVTEQVLRQWLDKHEEGKSLAQIANHFKVDRRTVEKHVPAAIERRRWQRLRDEIDSEELKEPPGANPRRGADSTRSPSTSSIRRRSDVGVAGGS